ncbi:glycosyltransferase family 2 protein [Curtobacterium ammoniigenes]|uniref:glycosyltransferase family 2 protein n=1 Tax=Curtobacterium ammoniigenes TaxID=395387 RepID=UPI000AD878B0|nr:glycosyltransferase family 2 protein [Curtobacterium ammoniigenes]
MTSTSVSAVAPHARPAAEWARPPADRQAPEVDVLIPSAGRSADLAVTLAGLAGQDRPSFRVTISDQSPGGSGTAAPAVQAMLRVLDAQGRAPRVLMHPERRGLAEQRQFLLDHADAPAVLFLDDDVWLEPGTVDRMLDALRTYDCGLIGSAVQGLSYLDDERPDELRAFEPWDGPVKPERVRRGTPEHDRWPLHNAANPTHLAARHVRPDGSWRAYRIAWVGGCVLYDREDLLAVGGFDFWRDLPPEHAGEDVVAQWRVMERFGGAGVLPSGAVHTEAPTTVVDRRIDAPDVLMTDRDDAAADSQKPEPPRQAADQCAVQGGADQERK